MLNISNNQGNEIKTTVDFSSPLLVWLVPQRQKTSVAEDVRKGNIHTVEGERVSVQLSWKTWLWTPWNEMPVWVSSATAACPAKEMQSGSWSDTWPPYSLSQSSHRPRYGITPSVRKECMTSRLLSQKKQDFTAAIKYKPSLCFLALSLEGHE
jgi:hypothetical protein